MLGYLPHDPRHAGEPLQGEQPMRVPTIRIPAHARNYVHWALIHAALVLFALDIVAEFWPAFGAWWSARYHMWVAVAAFSALLAENYIKEEERKHHA
jgi:hypothetical protein